MTGEVNNSIEQDAALSKIKEGKNVLILGVAGSGKSSIIRQILDNNTVLCAPTGIAALNIGGSTCHRVFGLPLGVPEPKDFLQVSGKVRELFNVYSPVKRIVIDEQSCLRLDALEVINSKLQMARGNNKPFGGLQIVLVGDYFQLDPIVSSDEREAYFDEYPSPFNFKSKIFNFEVVELTKVFRQSDVRQAALLGSIRSKDKYYKRALDIIIKESKKYSPDNDTTVLCCYKADVKKYNRQYFNKLSTPIQEFKATITGDDEWSSSSVPHRVRLRVGAKVMFKANDPDDAYVNGEKGEVTYVEPTLVKVRKESGKEVIVNSNIWEKFEYKNRFGQLEKKVISTFTQIPLDLAYAQSIHSCQGITVDDVAIDIGRGTFSHGQLYVAMSRVRDLKRMSFVVNPSYRDVIVHKDVKEFHRNLESQTIGEKTVQHRVKRGGPE